MKIGFALLLALAAGAASAQSNPDWAQLGRYREADARQIASGRRPDLVLIGDSITEGWLQGYDVMLPVLEAAVKRAEALR